MSRFGHPKKNIIIIDEVFGPLEYKTFRNASENFFYGKCRFPSTESDTELSIQVDPSGPTEEQRALYRDLTNNFDRFATKIKSLIQDEFRKWQPNFAIADFGKECTSISMSIPKSDTKPIHWQLDLTTIHDRNHYITIELDDDAPTSIFVDG